MPTVLVTTQPGWAFATLAELRARGVKERLDFHHRDSTVLLPAEGLPKRPLLTAAETCGMLVAAYESRGWDATRALVDALWRAELARGVTWWMGEGAGGGAGGRGGGKRGKRGMTWAVSAEVWGDTQVQRRQLAAAVRQTMRAAFPGWTEASYEEAEKARVRLVVKADTRVALVGVQLASTLTATGGRPGALRQHLACGLLSVAGLDPGGRRKEGVTVVDPFAGSGTILEAAGREYGAAVVMGSEADRAAARLARQRLEGLEGLGVEVRLQGGNFEALEAERLPEGAFLVSNLPFGERFTQVETGRLVAYLGQVAPRLAGVALLMARGQAAEVAERLGMRTKNVIVLGQPAAITYTSRQRI